MLCLSKVLSKQGVISVICEDLNQFHSSAARRDATRCDGRDAMWRGGFVCLFARSPAPTSLTTRVAQLILHDLEMPYDIAFSIDSAMLAGAGSDAAMDG